MSVPVHLHLFEHRLSNGSHGDLHYRDPRYSQPSKSRFEVAKQDRPRNVMLKIASLVIPVVVIVGLVFALN